MAHFRASKAPLQCSSFFFVPKVSRSDLRREQRPFSPPSGSVRRADTLYLLENCFFCSNESLFLS